MSKFFIKQKHSQDELKMLVNIIDDLRLELKSKKNDIKKKRMEIRFKQIEHEYLMKSLKRIHNEGKYLKHFINRCFGKSTAKIIRQIIPLPIEEMPLFLNHKNLYVRAIVTWRLQIGK